MNREIKFRAWDKETKKMVKVQRLTLIDTLGWHTCSMCGHHIGLSGNPYILMQYTGLKDKNGKEIYEGDQVRFKLILTDEYGEKEQLGTDMTGWIIFEAGGFAIRPYGEDDFIDFDIASLSNDFKITGNIYENPKG